MRWGGVIVAAFIIYHLLDLTWGAINPAGATPSPTRLVAGFTNPFVTAWYAIALILLGIHLRHGIWSATQTLGQSNKRRERTVNASRSPSPSSSSPASSWSPSPSSSALDPTKERAACLSTCSPSATRSPTPRRRWTSRSASAGTSASSGAGWSTRPTAGKLTVIVVGTGLAGGSAAATLGELGYKVKSFWYQDSPRRAHSVAAQGGINAAKNYRNDGDSVYRLFYDTVKGGDFRSRESNVLPPGRGQRQHHRPGRGPGRAVRPRVRRPARQPLLRRRPGVAHLLRPRPDGPAAALGAYQALERQVAAGNVEQHARTEMLDLVVVDGRARGIVARDLVTGEISTHFADAVVLATGGYGNVFYLSTNAKGCNVTAIWRAHKRGAYFANPCYTQIHPTCIPVKRRLPVEADADERVAAQRRPRLGAEGARRRPATRGTSPRTSATTTWSGSTRPSATWCPRDIASRAAKNVCDEGRGVGPGGLGVYLDFADAIERLGRPADRGQVRQPLRDVRADHRRGPLRRRRCGSTPPCTTRWAGCGSTTTCSPRSPACS